MNSIVKTKHLLGVLGLIGFLLCAWFAYQCGLSARDSASRAYMLWLSGGGAPSQVQIAARLNWGWIVAAGASLLLGVMFLSASFSSKGAEVRRRGMGLLLLCGSFFPFGFAFTILSPLLNLGVRVAPGARIGLTSWSSGGITFRGWQMYAGASIFALVTFSMLGAGAYLLLTSPHND